MVNENASEIVHKVWSFYNPLRDIGVGYGDYLEQLTYLQKMPLASNLYRKSKPSPIRLRRSRTKTTMMNLRSNC